MATQNYPTPGESLSTSPAIVSRSIAGDLAEQYARLHTPQPIPLTENTAIALPNGMQLLGTKAYLDQFRKLPERRKGTAQIEELESFIEHVNRFKNEHTALFAERNPAAPTLQAVYDYHPASGENTDARWCGHRAVYACPVSAEWAAWLKQNEKPMLQGDFAAFLEERILDVIVPPDAGDEKAADLHNLVDLLGGHLGGPAQVMAVSRGLKVNVDTAVHNAQTLANGEVQIQYTEQHNAKDGVGQPMRVPTLFLIAIPVFRAGPHYQIAIRLRYRLQQGRIQWSYHLYRLDRVFDDAFSEVCAEAEKETELPLYLGKPEAA